MNWVEFPHNYLLLLEHQENNDHRSLSSIDAMTRNKKLQWYWYHWSFSFRWFSQVFL